MKGNRIYLSSPHMSDVGYEMQFVSEAFETNWIAPLGENVDKFEKEFAEYVGVKHAAALTTGTSALHLSLRYTGVGNGDIVFCQSLTFSATANAIIYQNAVPVFIDSDVATWNMCPVALEEAFVKYEKLGKLPKAVVVVHLYGLSADIDKILSICNKYKVPLIEDAAESLGTTYKGKQTGSYGKFGIFSFNGNKIITTSGGGMLVSDDEEAIKKVRFWATQSRDNAKHYEHSELGFNYRMSNVLAGIGRGQLKILNQRVEKKRYIFDFYQRHLPDFQFMPINDWNKPNCWLSCMLVDRGNAIPSKDVRASDIVIKIIEALEAENIEARPVWKPMHLQPYFKDCDFVGMGVSDTLFYNGICLPSDTKIQDEDLLKIVSIIKDCD